MLLMGTTLWTALNAESRIQRSERKNLTTSAGTTDSKAPRLWLRVKILRLVQER